MANAGRILILPKGEWNVGNTYSMLDMVAHGGASWVAKKTVVGIEPTEANSEHWMKMVDVEGKQDTITGGATSITDKNLTASRALVSDANGKVVASAVTAEELRCLDGVTDNIQTQLNDKAKSTHTHNYAGSTSEGGSATSALECTGNSATATTATIALECSGNSATATKATKDSRGQQIDSTYLKGISSDADVLTLTKGDGTTSTIKVKAGDEATVRYVSDETDVNFDWIQVKDADGEWINVMQAYTQRLPLYMTSANEGGFARYAGSANTVIFQTYENLKVGVVHNYNTQVKFYSKLVDFSRFKKLHFEFASYLSGTSNGGTWIGLTIDKAKTTELPVYPNDEKYLANSVAYVELLAERTLTKNGEVDLDVSSIEGEHYICILCATNSFDKELYVEIRNMYME